MAPWQGTSRGTEVGSKSGFHIQIGDRMAGAESSHVSTHPWINFKVDLREAPVELWVQIGEAQSRIDQLQGAPLKPELHEELHNAYLTRGVHASSAIEGNTLTVEQVRRRLEGKLELPTSQARLGREIDNLLDGYNMVMRDVLEGLSTTVTPERIREFNRVVLDGLDLDAGMSPGEFRNRNGAAAGYSGVPWQEVEELVAHLCEWLGSDHFAAPSPELSVAAILLKAMVAHLYIAWIFPFGAGNGPTARLVEYQIMVGGGLPAVVGHLLSCHYNATRTDYYLQLERSSRGGEGPVGFIGYAMRGFVDQIRLAAGELRGQQTAMAWQNYVHEKLPGSSPSRERQRNLVLDLAQSADPVHRSRLAEVSPRVIRAYAKKTPKTLTRDINQLRARSLMVFRDGGFVANTDLIRAFLPDVVSARAPANRRRRSA
jgi:Fic family protein